MLLNGLETERLRFRNLELSDAKIWIEFLSDPNAIKFFPPIANTDEYAQYWMERQLARYTTDGFGLYALIEKTSNHFIGQCGIMKQNVDDKINSRLKVGKI
jgi:[ribosomal protein S5]-alanine N-acetyltransferase